MAKSEPSWHIAVTDGTLCGSSSVAAWMRVANCEKCNKRLVEMAKALMDIAEEKTGAVERAKKLVGRLRLVRTESESDGPKEA